MKRSFYIPGLAILLLGIFTITPLTAQETFQPVFEAGDCPFPVPGGQTVDCGWLIVPEDHSAPDGRTLRLAVAIFRNQGELVPADPVIYLAGGPGENPLEEISLAFSILFEPLTAYSDLIIIDQRGTGFSEPALDCPEFAETMIETLNAEIDADEELEIFFADAQACAERLTAEGANLSFFNSAQSAADINALRIALGYEQVNLFGVSYGTRLAQTIVRDHPEGIRSVVLDSSYPLEVNLYTEAPRNLRRSLDVLFAGCAADTACSAAFPDLESVFYDTVLALEAEPAYFDITNPLTRETLEMRMDGTGFLEFMFTMLYDARIIPLLPRTTYETAAGDYSTISMLAGTRLAVLEYVSQGMQFSVQCNEEAAFNSYEEALEATSVFPELDAIMDASDWESSVGILEMCALWPSGTADAIENEPVVSDIPTLILAGEYDPVTPPSWGALIHENFSNSSFFTFPGIGHAAITSGDCPVSITLAFINDPAAQPDASCIDTMTPPQFSVPVSGPSTVAFEETTLEAMGVVALIPQGWAELAAGTYSRGESAIDQTVLLVQSAPMSAEGMLNLLSTQLGLEESPALIETSDYGLFTWNFYQADLMGYTVDIALAEADGTAYIVLLISAQDERDGLFADVMIPVLESVAPLE